MRNPLSIEAFADWASKQPVGMPYNFMDCEVCACGQYAATLGLSADEWRENAANNYSGFWGTANSVASPRPWTFGSLAKRLRSAS